MCNRKFLFQRVYQKKKKIKLDAWKILNFANFVIPDRKIAVKPLLWEPSSPLHTCIVIHFSWGDAYVSIDEV